MKEFIKNKLREDLDSHEIDKILNQIKDTNCDCCDYFDMSNLSNYGGMEHPLYFMIQKHRIFELIYMNPKQYIYKIASGFGVSYEDAMSSVYSDDKANKYAEDMKNGSKFPIGYFVYGKPDQEGRHRAAAAMKLGCEKIPVIEITELNRDYVDKFVKTYKDYSRDELDNIFKEKGYHGISDLDWGEFEKYINHRL